MPRTARLDIAGCVYHVITRGNERRAIFKDDADREEFVRRFTEALAETKSICYAWVLMSNHVHLVIRRGAKPLSTLMRKVLTGYAQYFNARHKRRGHLYQNRYKSILCQEEAYLQELIRYVHLNPMRAGAVSSMNILNGYRWSGHGALMGIRNVPWQETEDILARFGKQRKEAIAKYVDYVHDGMHEKHRDEFSGGGLRRSAGGWSGVMALRKSRDRWSSDARILGDGDFVTRIMKEAGIIEDRAVLLKRGGWNIERIAIRCCELMGVEIDDIKKRSRGTGLSEARSLIAYWANADLGLKVSEIANYFGITSPSVSEAIKRGAVVAQNKTLKLLYE